MTEGQGKVGGALLPPPEGLWGMPEEMLQTIPGYGPDVEKNRAEARKIMEKLGYGPDKRLEVKVSTRNVASFRDPAVILIDQLKQIYVDGVLETIETANWHSKVTRKDYVIGMNNTGSGVDDPDQQFFENYACGSPRNYSAYCNPELDKKFRRAVDDDRPGETQKARLGYRQAAAGGPGAADHFPHPQRDLPAALCEGRDADGQQHLQRLALRGRLARQVARIGRFGGDAPMLCLSRGAGEELSW